MVPPGAHADGEANWTAWRRGVDGDAAHLPTYLAACNVLASRSLCDPALDLAVWGAVTRRAARAERGWVAAWAAATASFATRRDQRRAVVAYADDVTVAAEWEALPWAYHALAAEYGSVGLNARRDKSCVLAPGPSVLADEAAHSDSRPVQAWLRGELATAGNAPAPEVTALLPDIQQQGIVVAGTPVGTVEFCVQQAEAVASASQELVHRAVGLTAQSQYQLLRLSVAAQVRHLARTLPPAAMGQAVELHDRAVAAGLAACTGVTGWGELPAPGMPTGGNHEDLEHAWGTTNAREAALTVARDMPLRLGGLGVIPIAQAREAAYLGSLALVAAKLVARYPGLGPTAGATGWGEALLQLGPVRQAAACWGEEARHTLQAALEAPQPRVQRALHQPQVELAFWMDTCRLAAAEFIRFDEAEQLDEPGGRASRAALEWRLSQLSRGASTWLQALPSSRGARMADIDFHGAVAARMGLQFVGERPQAGAHYACAHCGTSPPTHPAGLPHALMCQRRSKAPRHDRVVAELRDRKSVV